MCLAISPKYNTYSYSYFTEYNKSNCPTDAIIQILN